MNIVYITMQFPVPSETFSSLDIRALENQGHRVIVFGLRPRHREYSMLMTERHHTNLQVENFSFTVFVRSFRFLFFHPLKSLSLISWIFKVCFHSPQHLFKSLILLPSTLGHFHRISTIKPDVVHLFWGHYPSMLGFMVQKYMPETVLSQFLGAHDLVTNYPGSAALSEKADVVVTHANANIDLLNDRNINTKKVHVIHRGAQIDFPFVGDISKFDGLATPKFLVAARLIEEKGINNVIHVFASIQSSYPNAILTIAGEGPYRSNLESLVDHYGINEQVKFIGHVSQISLIEIMSEFHFFILLSRYPSERLPNVVKEAMYQQCVVITTNTDGVTELIQDKINGFIVNQSEDNSVIELVEYCLKEHEFCKRIAINAKNTITEKFNVNVSMEKYSVLWQNAIKGK